MLLTDLWQFFQETVFTLPGSDQAGKPAFNFYRQELPGVDIPGSAEIRRSNLKAYVNSFPEPPELLLVGEAPGWRGCRFSGVPFTSEAQLSAGELPFQGDKTSPRSKPYREASATIFWDALRPLYPDFFVWNALPLHLYLPGKPLSNRCPSRQEIRNDTGILCKVVSLLEPRIVVAIGNCASAALDLAGIEHLTVRHPAHGGARDFRKGIESMQNSITIGG